VGERVTQLARLIQNRVAAQVDGAKVEQLEQGQQPAGADLGDIHHGQVAAHGVPTLQEQFPGGSDGLLQCGGAFWGGAPR